MIASLQTRKGFDTNLLCRGMEEGYEAMRRTQDKYGLIQHAAKDQL